MERGACLLLNTEEERGGIAEEKASKTARLCLEANTAYLLFLFCDIWENPSPPIYLHIPPYYRIYWFNCVLVNALSFILHISTCSYNWSFNNLKKPKTASIWAWEKSISLRKPKNYCCYLLREEILFSFTSERLTTQSILCELSAHPP